MLKYRGNQLIYHRIILNFQFLVLFLQYLLDYSKFCRHLQGKMYFLVLGFTIETNRSEICILGYNLQKHKKQLKSVLKVKSFLKALYHLL